MYVEKNYNFNIFPKKLLCIESMVSSLPFQFSAIYNTAICLKPNFPIQETELTWNTVYTLFTYEHVSTQTWLELN